MLLRQPHSRFQVLHEVVVARAREREHEFFELAALQAHLGQAQFGHREPCLQFLRERLGLFGVAPRVTGQRGGILRAAGHLLLGQVELLPEQTAQHERQHRQRHANQCQAPTRTRR